MGRRDERVDAYIANSAEFARPILKHLRELVHSACPEVEETMKWSRPHFLCKGLLCGISAFKGHCAFGFWKGSAVVDGDSGRDGMGQFGKITALSDLPSDEILVGLVREAMRLNEEGVPSPSRSKPKSPKPEVVVPDDLAAELAKHDPARAAFEKLSPSHRREYVEWIVEAKTPATRSKRIRTTLEWLAEGKPRNWKYMNC
jgi:uncharacterized protein YdeI (YjbR/CyaY-like superfamily)